MNKEQISNREEELIAEIIDLFFPDNTYSEYERLVDNGDIIEE